MNASKDILIMIVISFIIGYITMPIILGVSPYVRIHLNKVYGSLLMGFLMGLVELYMVWEMLDQKQAICILTVLTILSLVMIYVIIEQIGITEKEYLESMIEHHAMAINMSNK